MSNLTDLVPSLELCKLIPAGEFADSALVWIDHRDVYPEDNSNPSVVVRSRSWAATSKKGVFPAPTLKEIMSELSLCDECGYTGWFCLAGATDWSIGNCECDLHVKNGTENNSPEAAAIKVWLKLKGGEDGTPR